jgi:hypothetical protein
MRCIVMEWLRKKISCNRLGEALCITSIVVTQMRALSSVEH